MSSLGGRAAKVTRGASPQRVFPKMPAAQLGEGHCSCDGLSHDGVSSGGGSSWGVGGSGGDTTDSLCTSDMHVEVTVGQNFVTYLSGSGGNQQISVVARAEFGDGGPVNSNDGGYYFAAYIYSGNQGLWPNCTWELFGPDGFTSITSTSAAAPVAGDVLSIDVNGTSVVCKKNGGTVFSVSDSSVTDGVFGGWLGGTGFGSGSASGFSATGNC